MLSNEFCRNDSRYRPPLFDQTCSIMDRDGNVFMAKLAEQVTTFRAAASSRGPPNIRSQLAPHVGFDSIHARSRRSVLMKWWNT